MLTIREVAKGRYNVTFLPSIKKSPGNLPSSRNFWIIVTHSPRPRAKRPPIIKNFPTSIIELTRNYDFIVECKKEVVAVSHCGIRFLRGSGRISQFASSESLIHVKPPLWSSWGRGMAWADNEGDEALKMKLYSWVWHFFWLLKSTNSYSRHPRKRSIVNEKPISSKSSRLKAACALSPLSTCPPGR